MQVPNRTEVFTVCVKTAPKRTVGLSNFKAAPNRIVGYITAPNITVGLTFSEHRTEPYTVRFCNFQNRTEPAGKIFDLKKPAVHGRITVKQS